MLTVEQAVKVYEWKGFQVFSNEPASKWALVSRLSDVRVGTYPYAETRKRHQLNPIGSDEKLIENALCILSQSEEVMGRVREWHSKYGAAPCLKSLCSDNSYVGYGRFEKPESLVKQALEGGMTLAEMGVEG